MIANEADTKCSLPRPDRYALVSGSIIANRISILAADLRPTSSTCVTHLHLTIGGWVSGLKDSFRKIWHVIKDLLHGRDTVLTRDQSLSKIDY